MLELASLGLLQKEPLHGYQLTKTLEMFMGCCISVNYGAIYPLLRRLESRGFITALSTTESTSSRIIYRITSAGSERWRSLMLETPNESWVNSRSRFMIKSFFFDVLDSSDRQALIRHRLARCWEREQMLRAKDFPLDHLDHYQSLTYEQGLRLLQVEVDWLNRLLLEDTSQTAKS